MGEGRGSLHGSPSLHDIDLQGVCPCSFLDGHTGEENEDVAGFDVPFFFQDRFDIRDRLIGRIRLVVVISARTPYEVHFVDQRPVSCEHEYVGVWPV